MKRTTLAALLKDYEMEPYSRQYSHIIEEIQSEHIRPVKASPLNGKKPALHTDYWIVEPQKDYSLLQDELLYRTHPQIRLDYYLKHLPVYESERENVRRLSIYLTEHSTALGHRISYNERSFEIWGQEKFLLQGSGRTLLKHCGMELEALNCYETVEPFPSFSISRTTPQNILILENKDPFYSMRAHLLDGNRSILGTAFGTLIYGGGKRVISSFQMFSLSAEPYLLEPGNTFLYFGDLDYEGIGIYETLAEIFQPHGSLIPFTAAYQAMLEKGRNVPSLPQTASGQNRKFGTLFFSFFADDLKKEMQHLLSADLYIPQEILNRTDF